jgi:signal transduction histidine kinase
VSVADNGCGMDAETLKRAFDPFFSSLPAGRRRGLGLAKALRWIESSGGSIRLESKPAGSPGQGTRAMVLLPAAWPGATDATNTHAIGAHAATVHAAAKRKTVEA